MVDRYKCDVVMLGRCNSSSGKVLYTIGFRLKVFVDFIGDFVLIWLFFLLNVCWPTRCATGAQGKVQIVLETFFDGR